MSDHRWQSFFGPAYLRFSQFILTPERTQAEVLGIEQLLGLGAGSSILDLGCGQGRLSIPLAEKGFRVLGFDGSEVSLSAAKKAAVQKKVQIKWIEGKMKDLTLDEQVEHVINMGTALGYVTEEEDRQALARIYDVLQPGGKLLIDTENRDYKIRNLNNLKHRFWVEMDGQPVWTEQSFNPQTGRWLECMKWIEQGTMQSALLDLRLYSATELISFITEAGFQVEGVYSDLAKNEFTIDSYRMIILATK